MLWVDTKDKLPERGKVVLAWSTLDGGEYVLASLGDANNWRCQCLYGVSYYTKTAISHWFAPPEKLITKLITYQEAWDSQETYKEHPHGWIQWKGTDVCIDIHCQCGELSHFDGEFMYVIECPYCHRKYMANGHIQLIEIEDHQDHNLKTAEE